MWCSYWLLVNIIFLIPKICDSNLMRCLRLKYWPVLNHSEDFLCLRKTKLSYDWCSYKNTFKKIHTYDTKRTLIPEITSKGCQCSQTKAWIVIKPLKTKMAKNSKLAKLRPKVQQTEWPDFANFSHFGNILKSLAIDEGSF